MVLYFNLITWFSNCLSENGWGEEAITRLTASLSSTKMHQVPSSMEAWNWVPLSLNYAQRLHRTRSRDPGSMNCPLPDI